VNDSSNATGIILAGGQSRRMGINKALIEFQDQTLIERAVNTLRSVCGEIVVVANDPERYTHLGLTIVPDSVPDFGPLAGLHAGLSAMRSELGVVVAVDMPFLNPALIRAMIAAAEGWDAVIPALGEPDAESIRRSRAKDLDIHPLHAVYRRTCMPLIQAAIDRGDRRLNAFFNDVKTRYFSADEMRPHDPDLRSLINVNDPDELAQAHRLVG
jgi:molybdopterin-guanine dinucleotide biosynthesis protein A